MMCLFDLALGSLYSFGPESDQRREPGETVVVAAPLCVSERSLGVTSKEGELHMQHLYYILYRIIK